MSNAPDSQSVLLDVDSDGIATITLNRPQQFNTIGIESMRELAAVIAEVENNRAVKAVILRGAGPTFSGGGDIRSMRDNLADMPRFIGEIVDYFHAAILSLRRLKVPVISAVHGSAAGGGFSLALAADVVVAADTAKFVTAYPKLATSTDGGLSFFLTKRLGTKGALDVLLLRDFVSAQDALALGLITRVVAADQLETEAKAIALRLAAFPAQSVREIKQLVSGLHDTELAAQLAAERAAFLRCCAEPQFGERVVAFLTKK